VEVLDINGEQVAYLWMLAECQRAERCTLSEHACIKRNLDVPDDILDGVVGIENVNAREDAQ